MNNNNRHLISILMENEAGALSRPMTVTDGTDRFDTEGIESFLWYPAR